MIIQHRFNQLNQSGVTLIEMLVVMGLLSTMLVLIATIFTSAADVQQESQSYSSTLSSGRFMMARLNYDIARASAVTAPSSLGATSPSLDLTVNGASYAYNTSGSNMTLTDTTGTDSLNSADVTVSNVNFQELGNTGGEPTIVYSFTLTSTAQSHGVNASQTFSSAESLY
jgi:prepilin-type N-terminal cleavage/methylation domain-containing protein